MNRLFLLGLLLFPASWLLAQSVPSNTGTCLNEQEADLVARVNTLRVQNGLAPVQVSYWLSTTAQWHSWDLTANNPTSESCSMHSWSNARPSLWTGGCYWGGPNSLMHSKPRQISANIYTANGYENGAWGGSQILAATALGLWQNSPPHLDVILNRGVWASKTWRGMGVGIVGGYAMLWFGDQNDPAGTMLPCAGGGSPIDEVFDSGYE